MNRLLTVIFSFVLFQNVSFAAPDFAAKVQKAMELLKAKTDKLGPAKLEGEDTVASKKVPALYFGAQKINNNFELVDELRKEVGGTATLFVKHGAEYVRVSTNVQKEDESRAIGTVLDPKGKAIVEINKDACFYGEVEILGKPYTTGYCPIHDKDKKVIGIYYVGYLKMM